MNFRLAKTQDFVNIWPFFANIVRSQESYAIDPNISYEDALKLWLNATTETWLVEYQEKIIASYYIKNNYAGPGAHICNCGYMVDKASRGQGVATLMCRHSLTRAKDLGYRAMQYNLVASSNRSAIKIWQNCGFTILATIPNAFDHAKLGLIDAHVMHKNLLDDSDNHQSD